MNPRFSVIVPGFNEEKLLPACLQSLMNQTLPKEDYEVLYVDNNSTDRSVEIAKKFPVKVVHEKIQGIVAARNAGFQQSKGEIIVHLDADCVAPPHWLKRLSKYFEDEKVVLVSGVYKTDYKSPIVHVCSTLAIHFGKITGKCLGYSGGNVALRKSALLKVGGYDLRFPRSDQISLAGKMQKLGRAILTDDVVVESSSRRMKGRELAALLEFVSYFADSVTVKLLGKSVLRWETIR